MTDLTKAERDFFEAAQRYCDSVTDQFCDSCKQVTKRKMPSTENDKRWQVMVTIYRALLAEEGERKNEREPE